MGSAQNAVAPGKRPLSSMSPTVVLKDGAVKMVVGGAGGPTIISGVLQVLLNVLDQRPGRPGGQRRPAHPPPVDARDVLALERDIPRDVVEALAAPGPQGRRRATAWPSSTSSCAPSEGLEAAAEFRSGGGPAGY